MKLKAEQSLCALEVSLWRLDTPTYVHARAGHGATVACVHIVQLYGISGVPGHMGN